MSDKKKIVAEDILEMLHNGKTRKEIAEHYDVPVTALKTMMAKHPLLRNKKTIKPKKYDFEIVSEEEVSETSPEPENEVESLSQEEVEEVSTETVEQEWN